MILGFVGSFPPIKDGIADHNYWLVSNLAKERNIKKIICYSPQNKIYIQSKKIIHKKLPLFFNYEDFKLGNETPDIYHLQFGNSFPNSFVLRAFRILNENNQKIISTLHDKTNLNIGKIYRTIVSDPINFIYDFELIKKLDIIKKSKIIIVYSRYLKNIFENNRKIKVIFHGGEVKDRNDLSLWKMEKIKLVSFGFISPRKGFEEVIKAVKYLKERGFKIEYYIIGKINYFHYHLKLKFLIKKLNLVNEVKLLGYLPFNSVIKHIEDAHLVIQPRKYSTEGASGSLVFCLCSGKVVISNPIDYVPEYLIHQKTGFLVNHDPESYFNIITDIFSNRNKLYRIQRNVLKWARKNLDWNVISKKHIKLYKKVI